MAKDSPTSGASVAKLLAHQVSGSERAETVRSFIMEFLQKVGAVEHQPKWHKMAEAALAQEARMVG